MKKVKRSDNVKHSKSSADESCIERFLKRVRIGPVYVCVVCDRILCKSNVVLFNEEKYNFEYIDRRVDLKSFDNKHYICRTCDFKIKRSQVRV